MMIGIKQICTFVSISGGEKHSWYSARTDLNVPILSVGQSIGCKLSQALLH
jgi:hypothetical protein